jgi:two-component system sensor histidine kinase YesM
VMNRTLADKGVELHSVIYSPKNTISLVIGVLALAALGLISYMVFRRAAQVMADKNAHSVEQLVDEIKIIRNGDGQHIISIQTGDEYEMIAEQINKMVNSINSLNARNTELSYLNSAIELRNLQAQMNPHFIYNTLDNIKYLIPDDPGTAVRLIEKFAEILRYSINNTRALVPLEEDERYIRDYLFIQQTRFGERFAWTMEVEPGCERCTIPKLLAQPLLENSIKYGFRRKMELRVALNVRREGEYLAISVHDDGPGVSAEELETLRRMVADPTAESEHHGLRNLARRLRLQYGTGSGLILSGSEGEGFTVTAKLWNGGK